MAITGADVQGMVSHWLGCPPNGYLGSGYGSSIQDMIQTPRDGSLADGLVAKLRADIPVLDQLPAGATNIYAEASGPDRLNLFVEVAGIQVSAGSASL